MRRAWIRRGMVLVVGAALSAAASAVLLEAEPTPAGAPMPVRVASAPRGDTPRAEVEEARPAELPLEAPHREPPRGAGEVLREDRSLASEELARWVADEGVAPTTRYAALRRLERDDPSAAVTAAIAALSDVTPLVRLNAIAVLSRASDPRATDALGRLDDRSRRLAAALEPSSARKSALETR